jgi:plastocyanin
MRSILIALSLALPAAAAAQPGPRSVEVRLSSFDFTPSEIHLRAGEPVVLRLVNPGRGGHNFAAPEFFAAARAVSGPVDHGKVEVGSHGSAEVRLTPARGRYRLRCTHRLHTAFGMTGEIVVE